MQTITRNELGAELAQSKKMNHVFSVSFKKRDGSKRKMRIRWREDLENSTVGGNWANRPDLDPVKDYNLLNVMDDEILAEIHKEIKEAEARNAAEDEIEELYKKKRKAWRSILSRKSW